MQRLTVEQATQKIRAYCAYQERNHYEVKQKLYSYGLFSTDVEVILTGLIVDGYLNEERFARQFAGGKFRMKGWGKIKIIQELKYKKISPYNIKAGLEQIDDTQYRKTLEKLAVKKWESLSKNKERGIAKTVKTTRYLMQKGYELPLIKEILAALEAR